MRIQQSAAVLGLVVFGCGDAVGTSDADTQADTQAVTQASTAADTEPGGTESTSAVPTSSASAAPESTTTGDSDSATTSATTGEEILPGPWDHGAFIPPEPQTPGDPSLGYEALLTRGYISCGIPWLMFGLIKPFISPYADGQPLPGRPGKNAQVPYNWNVHTVDGAEIVSQNCLQCHAGSFDGKLVVGLGTADADFTDDMSELLQAFPIPNIPIPGLEQFTRFLNRTKVLGPQTVMRTVGTNPAEMVAVTLVAHRDRHTLAWSDQPLLPIPDLVIPSDPPPWWRAHKKHALFYNGMARGDHRGTMMLATALCTDNVPEAQQIDSYFHHIQAYINSLRAPAYPRTIDTDLAAAGEPVFLAHCAGCHGTYSTYEEDETYPNLLFPLDIIGTDPVVAEGGTKHAPHLVDWYNESFYGTVTRMVPDDPFPGYMAPPLDGVWATGPFLHNGSVPTIELVLDSKSRPTYWRRVNFNSAYFDEDALGWPFISLPGGPELLPEDQRKFVYDTTQVGHSNAGHTFGDHLTSDERRAVIEYLKTI